MANDLTEEDDPYESLKLVIDELFPEATEVEDVWTYERALRLVAERIKRDEATIEALARRAAKAEGELAGLRADLGDRVERLLTSSTVELLVVATAERDTLRAELDVTTDYEARIAKLVRQWEAFPSDSHDLFPELATLASELSRSLSSEKARREGLERVLGNIASAVIDDQCIGGGGTQLRDRVEVYLRDARQFSSAPTVPEIAEWVTCAECGEPVELANRYCLMHESFDGKFFHKGCSRRAWARHEAQPPANQETTK
jgi:hypothetical protein